MCKFREVVKKHRDGATLDIFVTPNASYVLFPSGYNKWRKRIEIRICSSVKDNKAKKEIIKTIANHFNKSYRKISIISGGKKREKKILIEDISVGDIIKKLMESLNGL